VRERGREGGKERMRDAGYDLGNPDEYTVQDFALLVRVRREGGREGGREGLTQLINYSLYFI